MVSNPCFLITKQTNVSELLEKDGIWTINEKQRHRALIRRYLARDNGKYHRRKCWVEPRSGKESYYTTGKKYNREVIS